jgi:hypothetical protein
MNKINYKINEQAACNGSISGRPAARVARKRSCGHWGSKLRLVAKADREADH